MPDQLIEAQQQETVHPGHCVQLAEQFLRRDLADKVLPTLTQNPSAYRETSEHFRTRQQSIEATLILGNCLYRLQQQEQAEQLFEQTALEAKQLKLPTLEALAYFQLGRHALLSHKFPKAQESLERLQAILQHAPVSNPLLPLYTRLLRAARQQWPEVFFELRRQDPWQIAIRTPDPQQLPEVQKWLVQEESRQLSGLLDENFQREGKDPLGRTGIQPDYNRIIDISSSELGDVAEALLQAAGGEQTPPRDLFNYLLAFVQAIPYQQLQSEDGRRGSGFLLPQQVLSNNRGDCDSKVTLLASLWRYLQPEIPLVLLFVPDHALLGVALPAQGAEETLTVAGGRWLLAEPDRKSVV